MEKNPPDRFLGPNPQPPPQYFFSFPLLFRRLLGDGEGAAASLRSAGFPPILLVCICEDFYFEMWHCVGSSEELATGWRGALLFWSHIYEKTATLRKKVLPITSAGTVFLSQNGYGPTAQLMD